MVQELTIPKNARSIAVALAAIAMTIGNIISIVA
jgi:hypothetical protein